MRFAVSLFLILLTISGCAKATEPENEITQPVASDSAVRIEEDRPDTPDDANSDVSETGNMPEEPPEVLAAQEDADKLLAAIKTRDADQLVRLLDRTILEYYGMHIEHQMAETIIEGFEATFDLNSLALVINKDGQAWSPEHGQYEFKLRDNQDENRFEPWSDEDRLILRYVEDGSVIYYNPYTRYFPDAGWMVSRYMELIQAEDAEGLAVFLNPDDIVVPIWVAEETIANYKQFLKDGRPTIRYLNRFFYAVDNGDGEEHGIEVIYGDGLMGIRDEFIPEF